MTWNALMGAMVEEDGGHRHLPLRRRLIIMASIMIQRVGIVWKGERNSDILSGA
jgi:hypothetical protein